MGRQMESGGCLSSLEKSMEAAERRGGVPVLILPSLNPNEARVRESPYVGASPILPAGILWVPFFKEGRWSKEEEEEERERGTNVDLPAEKGASGKDNLLPLEPLSSLEDDPFHPGRGGGFIQPKVLH